ncbi:glycine--tRNA ligase subunit beta [Spirulina sp. CS-785/01]|uniref:glycine--tRNA ligase subunit beta n=1 Tax=Spirulina sp. CS-785/01 TaxID=3021716 RepID=UPI00232DBC44|nr:glycine--tRNA ligase subunit beta [Spirulina sp. CS-785/01]MDB9313241.1 glycine--tRNA ligase subunit beta [Spirulina sp. CS-785/01]
MANFLLEVGTEELPADFVDSAIAQWKTTITKSLSDSLLTPENIQLYGTPRRLAVVITGLPPQQPDRDEEVKGPPASVAFKDGEPTKAAAGFAKKQGVAVKDLELRDTNKGEFVFLQKHIPGQKSPEILQKLIPDWINKLEGRRFMRWGDGDLRFPRPIRWLVALWDKEVLPVKLENGSTILNSDRNSYGHRVLSPEPIPIPDAASYAETLRNAGIEVDPQIRQHTITEQVQQAANSVQGVAEIPPDLLAEVINLVESPNAVVGKFDEAFLELPPEVIQTVMVTHQRYFPIKTNNNTETQLLPNFITISNGDPKKADLIAAGNERVIRARLADAKFFYDADCDEPLETYLPQLETVTFQADLGSMRDKVDNLIEIAEEISNQLNLNADQWEIIERAALLCKADLVSQMVYEFPELQGIMGEKYALVSRETPEVAKGIFEHYLPRGADDILPETLTGQVVGLADRLDTLVRIFGLGMIPTGSSDPFALRRAANGVINITWHANLEINLDELLGQFSDSFVEQYSSKTSPYAALQEFFVQRIRTLLQEELKIDYDLVNAVLAEGDVEYQKRALQDLLDIRDRAQFLARIRNNNTLDTIYETVNRSTRLAVKGDLDTTPLDPTGIVDPDRFEKASEQAFYDSLVKLVPQTENARENRDYQRLVDGLAAITPVVSNFFDGEDSVMVMAEDPDIQANRLNLLGLLRNHARVLANFGEIVVG